MTSIPWWFLLFVLVCFVLGYWLLSKIMDWSKKQVEGTAPKIRKPPEESPQEAAPPVDAAAELTGACLRNGR